MIDFRKIYHTGVIVENLEEAQAFYTESMGCVWAPIHIYDPLTLWSAAQGKQEIKLRVSYTREGPLHIELIEAVPGTFYDPTTIADTKHIGVFMDNVAEEIGRMTALGWTVIAARKSPEEGYGHMAYLLAPEAKMVVELVSESIKPMLLAWFQEPDELSPRYV